MAFNGEQLALTVGDAADLMKRLVALLRRRGETVRLQFAHFDIKSAGDRLISVPLCLSRLRCTARLQIINPSSVCLLALLSSVALTLTPRQWQVSPTT